MPRKAIKKRKFELTGRVARMLLVFRLFYDVLSATGVSSVE
jgi:hypothetical protein